MPHSRKAIEVWINLDRALYLAEQGLKVEVKQMQCFCYATQCCDSRKSQLANGPTNGLMLKLEASVDQG